MTISKLPFILNHVEFSLNFMTLLPLNIPSHDASIIWGYIECLQIRASLDFLRVDSPTSKEEGKWKHLPRLILLTEFAANLCLCVKAYEETWLMTYPKLTHLHRKWFNWNYPENMIYSFWKFHQSFSIVN